MALKPITVHTTSTAEVIVRVPSADMDLPFLTVTDAVLAAQALTKAPILIARLTGSPIGAGVYGHPIANHEWSA